MKKILTEWRKFLKEEQSREEQDAGFPSKIYHGISIDQLPKVRETGIINLSTDQDIESDKVGVPTCNSPFDAKQYGSVVLEIDGAYLQDSKQYEPHHNSKGCRVKMKDSAVMSGSGVDPMVDNLGSKIPFDAVSGIIFTGTPNLNQLKERGYGSIEISSFSSDSDDINSLHAPQEEEV